MATAVVGMHPTGMHTCYHLCTDHFLTGYVMFSVMSVCLSVCLCVCVCLSVFLSVQAITFEPLDIETSFLVCRYILTITRSSLSIKIIGSRSSSYEKNDNFTYFNSLFLCMWLQVINKVKVTHQGKGHIKIKVKISSSLPTLCKILLILAY